MLSGHVDDNDDHDVYHLLCLTLLPAVKGCSSHARCLLTFLVTVTT